MCSRRLPNEGGTFLEWLQQITAAADRCSRDIRSKVPKDLRKKLWLPRLGNSARKGSNL